MPPGTCKGCRTERHSQNRSGRELPGAVWPLKWKLIMTPSHAAPDTERPSSQSGRWAARLHPALLPAQREPEGTRWPLTLDGAGATPAAGQQDGWRLSEASPSFSSRSSFL